MSDDNDRRLVDLMMERLEQSRPWPYTSQPPQQAPQQSSSGMGTTFTIPQILSVLFAFVTIGGTLFAAWNGLTNKIETQKVSSDLTIEQMNKDIDQLTSGSKDMQTKTDAQLIQLQATIKELANRIDDLDSTVNQLYNRTTQKSN